MILKGTLTFCLCWSCSHCQRHPFLPSSAELIVPFSPVPGQLLFFRICPPSLGLAMFSLSLWHSFRARPPFVPWLYFGLCCRGLWTLTCGLLISVEGPSVHPGRGEERLGSAV